MQDGDTQVVRHIGYRELSDIKGSALLGKKLKKYLGNVSYCRLKANKETS